MISTSHQSFYIPSFLQKVNLSSSHCPLSGNTRLIRGQALAGVLLCGFAKGWWSCQRGRLWLERGVCRMWGPTLQSSLSIRACTHTTQTHMQGHYNIYNHKVKLLHFLCHWLSDYRAWLQSTAHAAFPQPSDEIWYLKVKCVISEPLESLKQNCKNNDFLKHTFYNTLTVHIWSDQPDLIKYIHTYNYEYWKHQLSYLCWYWWNLWV